MIAAKEIVRKSNTEMFDDVPVLQRKWQAALRPGEGLPRYEDVMLGSLGRLADHIVLLKNEHDTLEVSRTGRYVAEMARRRPLGHSPERAAAGLRYRARRSCGERTSQRPSLSRGGALRARWRGPDLRYPGAADILALGRHADRRLRQRARTSSTICWMRFSPRTDEGVLSLAAIRDFGRAAVRFPDRPSQSGRVTAAEAAIDRIAVAPAQRRRKSARARPT